MGEPIQLLEVNTSKDIEKLKQNNNGYVVLNIESYDEELLKYLKENGHHYFYSDFSDFSKGYNYVDFEVFIQAETIFDTIFKQMPGNLSELEKARYLYVSLGKKIILASSNDDFNKYGNENVWWSILEGEATNDSLVKIFLYLCKRANLNCKIVCKNDKQEKRNLLELNGENGPINFIVDLGSDLPFIKGNFKTRYFGVYNGIEEIDRKIHYITREYTEDIIREIIQKSNFNEGNPLQRLLLIIQSTLDLNRIDVQSLKILLERIFHKIYPTAYEKEEQLTRPILEISMADVEMKKDKNRIKSFLIDYNETYYLYDEMQKEFVTLDSKKLEQMTIAGEIIYEEDRRVGTLV